MIETVYPNFNILDEVTTSEIVLPNKRWIKNFEGPLPKNAHYPIPSHVDYESDGKYLCIPHFGEYTQKESTSSYIWSIGMVIFAIIVNYTIEPVHPLINVFFLMVVLFFLFLGVRQKKKEKFFKNHNIIFNRENGLVYLPPLQTYLLKGKVKYPETVVHFDDIECYYHVTGGGELRIDTYLVPNLPGDEFTPRIYEILFPFKTIDVEIKGERYKNVSLYWGFVCQFMDKGRPLPEVSSFVDYVNWFQNNNTTMPELKSKIKDKKLLDNAIKQQIDFDSVISSNKN